ncbi:MAG: adenylate/guanylate cyclase domain-containing protein [Bacteroidales bacterium]|nr:adenylate/guanylate cyclase domain-containing protein [Bacteroidales bacterium]
MISGNMGSASIRNLDYSVIGDTVNTARHLKSVAGPGQILIYNVSYEKVRESFNCRKVGVVSLKHKANEVTVYEVLN